MAYALMTDLPWPGAIATPYETATGMPSLLGPAFYAEAELRGWRPASKREKDRAINAAIDSFRIVQDLEDL